MTPGDAQPDLSPVSRQQTLTPPALRLVIHGPGAPAPTAPRACGGRPAGPAPRDAGRAGDPIATDAERVLGTCGRLRCRRRREVSRVDRVANIWGARTPFDRGARGRPGSTRCWPTASPRPTSIGGCSRRACCAATGAAATSRSGTARWSGCAGAAVDAVNHGRLGPKGLFGSWQGMPRPGPADPAAGPRRRRAAWRPTGTPRWARSWSAVDGCWPEAARCRTASTPAGSCSWRSTTRWPCIGKAGIGTPHMDGNTRLCTATAAAAMKETFGCDGQPGTYTDIEHCDALFLFGHNMAETQTVLWSRVLDRLAGHDPPIAGLRRPARRRAEVARRPAACTCAAARHQPRADERVDPGAVRARLGRRGLHRRAHRRRRRAAGTWSTRAPRMTSPTMCRVPARGRAARRRDLRHQPTGCCPPCCRASTSPTRRPRRPARSTTCTCCAACSAGRAAGSCR